MLWCQQYSQRRPWGGRGGGSEANCSGAHTLLLLPFNRNMVGKDSSHEIMRGGFLPLLWCRRAVQTYVGGQSEAVWERQAGPIHIGRQSEYFGFTILSFDSLETLHFLSKAEKSLPFPQQCCIINDHWSSQKLELKFPIVQKHYNNNIMDCCAVPVQGATGGVALNISHGLHF